MARLIDTSLRLLGQQPLAGRVPTGRVLEIASVLDRAGFHALEVSGGGCFESAIAAAIESPWERVRAIRRRVERTPLAMALRGTFLAGSQPVDADVVRRFILCAADSGIDIFRLHDPLNDADDLRAAAEAVREAGARMYAGLVYADVPGGDDFLVDRARVLATLGADRIILQDVSGRLDPAGVRELVERLRAASGLPIGLYVQGAGGTALAVAIEAARAGADPIAAATYPVAIPGHRPASEVLAPALAGLGLDPGLDRDALTEVALLVDRELGADASAPPTSAHQSLLAAIHGVPAELVAALERQLNAVSQPDRLIEGLEEARRVLEEVGSPPTASPVGELIVRQAIAHVLTGRRWATIDPDMRSLALGEWGHTPAPVAEAVRQVAEQAKVPVDEAEVSLDDARRGAGELAASDEELCLVALFGDRARPLLERMRGRADASDVGGADAHEERRIRSLITLLEESGATELTVEDNGLRVTVRKDQPAPPVYMAAAPAAAAPAAVPDAEPVSTALRVESPMVGNFYRSPEPGAAPFIEIGDRVEVGQTLCILEAMKLFNELKSEHAGTLRRIVAEDGQAVEFGQVLFELEP